MVKSMTGEWPEGVNEDDVIDIINGVAFSVHRKYRKFTSIDDIRQEMLLDAWRKRNKYAEYLVRENEGARRAGQAAFMRSMHRIGETFARKEKARLSGYEASDEFFYNQSLVEQLITAVAQGQVSLANQTGERSSQDPAEGGNAMVMIIDVKKALNDLDPETRALLEAVHGEGVSIKQVADARGVTEQAIRGRMERALRRIIHQLGGE
jgi:RNA polymerase sigma factor (sigma-70 family)